MSNIDEVSIVPLREDKDKQFPQYTEQGILQTISTMATFHDRETQVDIVNSR